MLENIGYVGLHEMRQESGGPCLYHFLILTCGVTIQTQKSTTGFNI